MSKSFDATAFLNDFFPTDAAAAEAIHEIAHTPPRGGGVQLVEARAEQVRKWRSRNSIPGDKLSMLIWWLALDACGECPDLGKYIR